MVGLSKHIYFSCCKQFVRTRECRILRLHLRFIIPYAIMILYVLSKFSRDSSSSHFESATSMEQKSDLEPLVTVIVTVYNVERFVQTAIRAVLSQSYRNLEVIVIDDASSDHSMKKVRQISRNDQRVRYITLNENTLGGVGIPTNIALEQSKGEYIALVDGDDFPSPNFIEKMLTLSLKLDLDISLCRFRSFEDSYGISKQEYDLQYWPNPDIVSQSQSRALDPLEFSNIFRLSPEPWRKLYKRSFLNENHIRFPEGDLLFEDNAFHWFVLRNAKKISFISDELVWHRENRSGQTTELKQLDNHINHKTSRKSAEERTASAKKESYVITRRYLARASHFLNIYFVGQDMRKCENKIRYCAIARTQFLMWIYRYKWLVALMESLEKEKSWRKFASIYFQTFTYWRKQFETSYLKIPVRKRVISQRIIEAAETNIETSIVVYCRNVEMLLSAEIVQFENVKKSIEYIFIDDNSKDSTLTKLSELDERYDTVHVIHMEGRGIGRAFNFAIPLCEGRYVIFLRYDTIANSEIFNYITRTAEKYTEDVLVFQSRWISQYKNGKNHSRGRIRRNGTRSIGEDRFSTDFSRLVYNGDGLRLSLSEDASIITVIRKDLILENSIFHGGTGTQDTLQFNWHLFLSAKSIRVFPMRRTQTRNDECSSLGVQKIIRYCRLRSLSVLLTTNRVLIKNGILKNKDYHDKWKEFCASRIANGIESFTNHSVNQYVRAASMTWEAIESHKSTLYN